MRNIYPDNFEQKVGFDKIRLMLSSWCLSTLGQEQVETMAFSSSFSEIEHQTGLVHEFLIILKEHDDFPSSHFYDMRPALQKLRVEGTFLEVSELFNLKRSLETIKGIVSFFRSVASDPFIRLRQMAGSIELFAPVLKQIDQLIDKFGVVRDNASAELHDIRKQSASLQSGVSKKMATLLRQLQSEGVVDADTAVAIRDGRPVIPVSSANKKKIIGIVHDESATGKTVFIEPAAIVEMNNRLRELANAEKREIIRILLRFSDTLRPEIDGMCASYLFLGTIDFIRCKALFARHFDCCLPEIRDEPLFDWQQSRHPLLMQALKKEKREVVPLSLRLDEPNRILLISGPNAGGKSVCLKTVGIIQYLFQCGMLVPMFEGSRMGIFQHLFIDIGDEQSIEDDLSTYSSHLMNMKFFIRNCNPRSLVLIDEFGTGTEPMLGGAIAEAVLDKLNRLNTYGIITTHYTNLKHFGASQRGIVNGAMLYDTEEMRPLFRLQIGKPGSSFAFEIARKIGLPDEIIRLATEKLGQEHIDYDRHLRDIVRDKQYWESKRLKIDRTEENLDQLSASYLAELEQTRKERKAILSEAKTEAQKILSEANKTVENTIREIRESQADKDKTKEIRRRLVSQKEELVQTDQEKEDQILRKIEQLKQRESRRGNRKLKAAKAESAKPEPTPLPFGMGDKVLLTESGAVGEVVEIDKNKAVIALGHLLSTVALDKLAPISNNEAKKQEKEKRMIPKADSLKRTNDLLNRKLTFKPDIDVRGQRADEALGNIQRFIDEAVMVGATRLRILHGKGYGILKEQIRNYLKTDRAVKSISDEHIQFGGAGITIVELE
ncbi:MAG TPA: Smr/MutS family protein [Prolixibacteraceae bacterium]|nr:Smr/MutS family protein [Prolixibacteraceae bacterium]